MVIYIADADKNYIIMRSCAGLQDLYNIRLARLARSEVYALS